MRAGDADGLEPICVDDPYPHYKEGDYDVICVSVVTYPDPRFRGRGSDGHVRPTNKCRLDCVMVTSQEPISGFFNLGNEPQPVVRRGSKYRRVWIMANGTAPRKRQRMSARTFVGKVFRVRIGNVSKDYEQGAHPDGAVYSTIKDFVACIGP
jgi:hypothetical protein